jgi:phosphoribosyl 1,2-cyclic phosphodiesterase
VFANSDTAKAIYGILNACPKFKIFATNEPFTFKDLEVHPFSVQHDAVDPVAFTIKTGQLKVGFCADLGLATTFVVNHLKECDYLYVEANHEPSMVHSSSRPPLYKQRVLGRQGHLSNEQCAELIEKVYHPGLKHVHLAHLSSECNSQELALKIIQERINSLKGGTEVSIAHQEGLSRAVYFKIEPAPQLLSLNP